MKLAQTGGASDVVQGEVFAVMSVNETLRAPDCFGQLNIRTLKSRGAKSYFDQFGERAFLFQPASSRALEPLMQLDEPFSR